MNICIGMPVINDIKAHTVYSLVRLIANVPKGNSVDFVMSYGVRQIHYARNNIIDQIEKTEWDAVLMIDDDMVFPANTLERLLNCGADISGVLYQGRVYPHERCVFSKNGDGSYHIREDLKPNTGVHEVDAIGSGIWLVKRSVFERLDKPYFEMKPDMTEDVIFCEKVKSIGGSIVCDTNLPIGHIGDTIFQIPSVP